MVMKKGVRVATLIMIFAMCTLMAVGCGAY